MSRHKCGQLLDYAPNAIIPEPWSCHLLWHPNCVYLYKWGKKHCICVCNRWLAFIGIFACCFCMLYSVYIWHTEWEWSKSILDETLVYVFEIYYLDMTRIFYIIGEWVIYNVDQTNNINLNINNFLGGLLVLGCTKSNTAFLNDAEIWLFTG